MIDARDLGGELLEAVPRAVGELTLRGFTAMLAPPRMHRFSLTVALAMQLSGCAAGPGAATAPADAAVLRESGTYGLIVANGGCRWGHGMGRFERS